MSGRGQREIVFNEKLQLWLFWDRRRESYYYYDARDDTLVYSDRDRTRIPRPSTVSRDYLQNPYATSTSTASQPTSPPTYAQGGPGPPWPATALPTAALGAFSINQSAGGQGSSTAQQTSGQLPVPVPPTVVERNGMRTVLAHDTRSNVRTAYATGPPNRISDPVLFRRGVTSKRMLISTGPTEHETLFSGYSIRTPGRKFFRIGRVFMVLWVEPAGETGTIITSAGDTMAQSDNPSIIAGRYNEKIFSKIRRFVVIREGTNFCSALPIVTYGKQGVGKPSVVKSEHAIIYTDREPPLPLLSERPGRNEQGMRPTPIRVVPDTDQDRLDPLSRIDFAKPHTVQHNIKVKALGMVHPHSMSALIGQFNNVWNAEVITRDNMTDVKSESGSQGHDRRRDSVASGTLRSGNVAVNSSHSTTRAEQAQDAYRRMRNRGFTREQAEFALVDQLRAGAPEMSEDGAYARVRFLLRQRVDEVEEEDDDDGDEEAEHEYDRDGGMTREEHDDLYR